MEPQRILFRRVSIFKRMARFTLPCTFFYFNETFIYHSFVVLLMSHALRQGGMYMKMWMVNPRYLCRQHLLGEHKELHMLVGCLQKSKNIDGYINNELVFPQLVYRRHNVLVDEMLRRGYGHKSPLPLVDTLPYVELTSYIIKHNLGILAERCNDCFVRIYSGMCDDE